MKSWTVEKNETGKKLVAFIRERLKKKASGKQIKAAVDRGLCKVNGSVEKFGSVSLKVGDSVDFDDTILSVERPSFDTSRILYDDSYLLAYDKPPHVACDEEGILTLLKEYIKTPLLVHRLDQDTSGVLLIAKNPAVQKKLELLFENRQVTKTYWALAEGIPSQPSGICQNYIGRWKDSSGQVFHGEVPAHKGQLAVTKWKMGGKGSNTSLILAFPETGRTHQIRIHLQNLGHPILGDLRYSAKHSTSKTYPRQMLHAKSIVLTHPGTNEKLRIESPLPEDFRQTLSQCQIRY